MNVGNGIKLARKCLGISQEDLSSATGLTQTSISKIENGSEPHKKTLKKIAEAMNVPEDVFYMLGFEKFDFPKKNWSMYEAIYPAIKELVYKIIEA